jgi:hypothetical protein
VSVQIPICLIIACVNGLLSSSSFSDTGVVIGAGHDEIFGVYALLFDVA